MNSRESTSDGIQERDVSAEPNPLDALKIASRSDIGLRREENQDSFGIIERGSFKLIAVADGMGGVKGGAVASGIAIATLKESIENVTQLDEQTLVEAISRANNRIFEEAVTNPGLTGMGTTMVALGFIGTDLFVANVGDSRAYRIRGAEITQLTEDHTLVMELLRSGTISPEQAENHPVSHMLTRSLGPSPEIEVDCWRSFECPKPGDFYLLCSDGLYNLVGEEEIATLLASQPIEEVTENLVKLANERGGTDNITVVIVRVGEEYPLVEQEAASIPVAEAVPEGEDSELQNLYMQAKANRQDAGVRESKIASSAEAVQPSQELQEELVEAKGTQADSKVEESPIQPVAQSESRATATSKTTESSDSQGANSSTTAAVKESVQTLGNDKTESPPNENPKFRDKRAEPETTIIWGQRNNFRTLLGVVIALVLGGLGGAYFFGSHSDVSIPETPKTKHVGPKTNPLLALRVESGLPPLVESSPSAAPDSVIANNKIADPTLSDPTAALPTGAIPPNGSGAPEKGKRESPTFDDGSFVEPHTFPGDGTTSPPELKSQPLTDLSTEQVARILRRRDALKSKIKDMSDKIDSFDKPFSGNVGRVLTDAEGRIEAFQRELEDVKKEVDKATRKLAVWYQRKKQLREIDPINFAAPVALTSEEVKKKHEAFKEVTAVYIREAETLILNPEDQKQSKKVAELIADRRQKMTELGDAVKAAVEKEISEADQHVAELALSRDHIELNLQTAKRDVSYAKVLMSADEGAKSRLREDMVREINSAKAELDSLTQLVPPSLLKKAPTSGSRSPFSDAAG